MDLLGYIAKKNTNSIYLKERTLFNLSTHLDTLNNKKNDTIVKSYTSTKP